MKFILILVVKPVPVDEHSHKFYTFCICFIVSNSVTLISEKKTGVVLCFLALMCGNSLEIRIHLNGIFSHISGKQSTRHQACLTHRAGELPVRYDTTCLQERRIGAKVSGKSVHMSAPGDGDQEGNNSSSGCNNNNKVLFGLLAVSQILYLLNFN